MKDYNDIGLEDMAHEAAMHETMNKSDKKTIKKSKNTKSTIVSSTSKTISAKENTVMMDNGLEEMAYIAAQSSTQKKVKPSVASKIKSYIETVVHGQDDTLSSDR